VRLLGFIIRKYITMRGHVNVNSCNSVGRVKTGCVDSGSERCYIRDYVRKLCEQKAGIIQRRNKSVIRVVGRGKINTENIKGTRSRS